MAGRSAEAIQTRWFDDAWAVGRSSGSALVEHWNGSRWAEVQTPVVDQSELLAVEATSPKDVWAVGNRIERSLIVHWDGRSWKVIPNPAAPRAVLRDIAALSARDIWVVGDYGPPAANNVRPLLEHWDGRKWAVVSPPVRRSRLESIAALSSRDIWVSGERGSPTYDALVAHRLGTTWRVVRTPRINGQGPLRIAAAARDDVWAVGDAVNNAGKDLGVIEHYGC